MYSSKNLYAPPPRRARIGRTRALLPEERQDAGWHDAMMPMPVRLGNQQTPAAAVQIFDLRRTGEGMYHFLPTDRQSTHTPPVDGFFHFVILVNQPFRVYCGRSYSDYGHNDPDRQFGVRGHTSLTHRQPVLYAGDVHFRHGCLTFWDNSSGHYCPDERRRLVNFSPVVRQLLPEDRFRPYRE